MRNVPKAGAVLLALTLSMTSALRAEAYTKPGTLKISAPSAFLFPEQYPISPHTWTILRAVELLRDDGFVSEADRAEKYLLPMMLGATYNDVCSSCGFTAASSSSGPIPATRCGPRKSPLPVHKMPTSRIV